jgi:hypothetical protein
METPNYANSSEPLVIIDVTSQSSLNNLGKSGQKYTTFASTLVLCSITAVFSIAAALYLPAMAAKRGFHIGGGAAIENKVVYLDFERLLAAGLKRSMDTAGSVGDVQAQADKFQADIRASVKAYSDAGYIVINNKALIGGSKDKDITASVIENLGTKP